MTEGSEELKDGRPEAASDTAGTGEAGRPESGAEAAGTQTDAERIAALEAEIASLRDSTLRARAEVENVLKRTEREKQDIASFAIAGFARDLLTVSDNLRRTLEATPAELRAMESVKVFIDGVEMIERDMLAAFGRHGIEKIDPKGERFDAHRHQAMAEVESTQEAGTIVDVYQPGYMLKGRLLRPAMVTVAKAPGKDEAAGRVDTTA
ncbi:MAG: nucleotide exchange factor GrpE [Rhodothalassiaceae bacterium]